MTWEPCRSTAPPTSSAAPLKMGPKHHAKRHETAWLSIGGGHRCTEGNLGSGAPAGHEPPPVARERAAGKPAAAVSSGLSQATGDYRRRRLGEDCRNIHLAGVRDYGSPAKARRTGTLSGAALACEALLFGGAAVPRGLRLLPQVHSDFFNPRVLKTGNDLPDVAPARDCSRGGRPYKPERTDGAARSSTPEAGGPEAGPAAPLAGRTA